MSRAWTLTGIQLSHPLDRRYAWKAINDSSGCFENRIFQMQDVVASAKTRTWPNDIEFINIYTGKVLRYAQGEIISVETQTSIGKIES